MTETCDITAMVVAASRIKVHSWAFFAHLHGPLSPHAPPRSPEKGQAVVYNAFIGTVIGIGEERSPACWQRVCIHSKPVILGCQKAAPGTHQ